MNDKAWLLFGGPYSNLQATEALLAEAKRLGIPSEQMLCTGDLVAYCGDPVATIDRIREAGIAVVMGNCDEQLGAGASDCGCGFEPDSACARLSADWYSYANSVVRPDQRLWLAGLPRRIDLDIGGRKLAAIHGSANSINAFVFSGTPEQEKRTSLDEVGCDGVIGGHSGLPFTDRIDHRLWHNPGVIGMPANDGTARVWFSLIIPEPAGLRIEHRSLAYDIAGAQAAMARAALPACYREALATGLWPSLDVLTERERRETGKPIKETGFLWSNRGDHHLSPAEAAA